MSGTGTTVRFIVEPPAGFDPEVAPAIWGLRNARARTLKVIDGLSPEVLDAQPVASANTIGTLLYHIAEAEAAWLFKSVLLLQAYPPDVAALMPHAQRDEQGILSALRGATIESYLHRLNSVREKLLEVYRGLTAEQFRVLRARQTPFGASEATAEFVLYQLMQHEAEHRGQIQTMIEAQGITPKNVPF